MSTKLPRIYLHHGSYYFRVMRDGRRIAVNTGSAIEAEAVKFEADYIRKLKSPRRKKSVTTLADVLSPFCDPETNPRRLESSVTGRLYGLRHAQNVALYTRRVGDLINEHMPAVLRRPVKSIDRKTCKDIMFLILDKKGRTDDAQQEFKALKSALAYAYDEGLVPTNPAAGLPDIKVERKGPGAMALDPHDIALIMRSDVFPSGWSKNLFALFASTGMRRGELLALDWSQIVVEDGIGVIRIDRGVKDASFRIVGKPKWDKVRVIPMPEIARCAVESQRETTGGRGLVFPGVTPKIFQETMDTIKIGAMALPGLVCKEAVAQLTAHKLRHSLNTNLMLAGANPLLVRTYLSWEHQGSNAVQAGYTHVYARNLLPVARVIDDMYSQDVIDKAIGFPAGR